ncbi:MAG: saccharopine dehydrogenase C-terminal domain-containing protein [Gammaproteobacteria bacterium]
MKQIAILGAGTIGTLIACLLASTGDYGVHLMDVKNPDTDLPLLDNHLKFFQIDVTQETALEKLLVQQKVVGIISSLPYFFNINIAKLARKLTLHYFDLTEDVHVSKKIAEIAASSSQAFVPHCGMAPGFINILAHDLIEQFDSLDTVYLRVGDLPTHVNNALHYALLWSTDGIINEYGNVCYGVVNGEETTLQPLEDLETVEIDGLIYEAFNTSGGVGNLVHMYTGKVKNLNYKTIRYPGHCEKMRFLMKDLKLNENRSLLKTILENALPKTKQDVVLIYVAVTGSKKNQLIEETYVKKIYPQTIYQHHWTAIQVTTASGLCAVVDIVLNNPQHYHGLIRQEQFSLAEILQNRFGKVFQ